jgi:hypothetical protein
MSDKPKSMCDMKKDTLKRYFDRYLELVKNPEYACKKCGRVASEEKWVCKPISLSRPS